MSLHDIYYYFITFAMIAGVITAYLLNLDIGYRPGNQMEEFMSGLGLQIASHGQRKNNVLEMKLDFPEQTR